MVDDAISRYGAVREAHRRGEATWDDLIEAWGEIAVARGELAGMPWMTDRPFVAAPRYSLRDEFHGATRRNFLRRRRRRRPSGKAQIAFLKLMKKLGRDPERQQESVHNVWFSQKLGRTVWVLSRGGGKRYAEVSKNPDWKSRYHLLLETHHVAGLYSTRAEERAMALLRRHVTEQQYTNYLCSGTFSEQSKRSGIHYVFRRMRPTIAISRTGTPLTALCLHAIGHYEATWAGGMVPTDDVVTHLLYMRADEKKFWGKAEHHPLWHPTSGV